MSNNVNSDNNLVVYKSFFCSSYKNYFERRMKYINNLELTGFYITIRGNNMNDFYWFLIENGYYSIFDIVNTPTINIKNKKIVFTCHHPLIDKNVAQFNIKIFDKNESGDEIIVPDKEKILELYDNQQYKKIFNFQTDFNVIIKIEQIFKKIFSLQNYQFFNFYAEISASEKILYCLAFLLNSPDKKIYDPDFFKYLYCKKNCDSSTFTNLDYYYYKNYMLQSKDLSNINLDGFNRYQIYIRLKKRNQLLTNLLFFSGIKFPEIKDNIIPKCEYDIFARNCIVVYHE